MSFVTNKSLKVALEGVKSELDNNLPTKVSQLENDSEYITKTETYNREQIGWLLDSVNSSIDTKADKDELDNIDSRINNIENDLYGDSSLDTGNAVLVNKTTLEKISVKPDDLSNYSPDEWEPIGVVVIPSSHDVYGTGECGVMALMSASLETPDTGQTSNADIIYGFNIDYSELMNFDACSSYGNQNTWTPVQLKSGKSCLPSDQTSFGKKLLNPNGEQSSWYYYQDNNHHTPSPYNEDGSRNPDYYDTNIGLNNALSDFAGKSNTEFLCSEAISQPDWKIDETINNNYNNGYHPAACCCWRFHTPGTGQGDWYLPACGELGYVCVRFEKISSTITALQTYFEKTFCPFINSVYWSSSIYSSNNTRNVTFGSGMVSYSYQNLAYKVRPFTRLNLSKKSKYYTKQETDELISNINSEAIIIDEISFQELIEKADFDTENYELIPFSKERERELVEIIIPKCLEAYQNHKQLYILSMALYDAYTESYSQCVISNTAVYDENNNIVNYIGFTTIFGAVYYIQFDPVDYDIHVFKYSNEDGDILLNKLKQFDGADSGLDADLLDGRNTGVVNGRIPYYINFPSITTLKNNNYLSSDHNADDTESFFKAICKWANDNYANNGRVILQGYVIPNSGGYCVISFYSDNAANTEGIPHYINGVFYNIGGGVIRFGYSNYEWFYRTIATTTSNVESANKLTTKQLTNEDLDTLIDQNFTTYYAGGGNTCLNKPTNTIDSFGLISMRNASGYYTHIIVTGTNIYFRAYNGATKTWDAWKRMITENDITSLTTRITQLETKVTDLEARPTIQSVAQLPSSPNANTLYVIPE